MSLILNRKAGQEIIIGGVVTIRVVESSSLYVKLAFDAPKEITVDRAEVHHRKQRQGEKAQTCPEK